MREDTRAWAYAKRLSLRDAPREFKKAREAWDQNHLPGSVVGSGQKIGGKNRIILLPSFSAPFCHSPEIPRQDWQQNGGSRMASSDRFRDKTVKDRPHPSSWPTQPRGPAKRSVAKKQVPNSCAILSSGGAAPGPKEGRFGTAQALEKRLSLRACTMPGIFSWS